MKSSLSYRYAATWSEPRVSRHLHSFRIFQACVEATLTCVNGEWGSLRTHGGPIGWVASKSEGVATGVCRRRHTLVDCLAFEGPLALQVVDGSGDPHPIACRSPIPPNEEVIGTPDGKLKGSPRVALQERQSGLPYFAFLHRPDSERTTLCFFPRGRRH